MKKVLQIFLLMLSLSSWSFADVQSQIAQLHKEDKEQITILLQKIDNQLKEYLFTDVSEAISQAKDLIVDKDDENRIALMENKVIDKQKIYNLYTKTINSIDSSNYNDSLYQQLKSIAKDSNDKDFLTKIDSYYNKSGYNKLGYNINGYDKDGYDKFGYNKSGYDRSGYDKTGYTISGYDKLGYNKTGYDRNGYNKLGYSISGYDKDGYDKSGRDKNGYDKNGYDKSGFDSSGWNSNKINKTTKTKYDSSGYDYYGYDKSGYNSSGYNANGYNKNGISKYAKSTLSTTTNSKKNITLANVKLDIYRSFFFNSSPDEFYLKGPSHVTIDADEYGAKITTYDMDKGLAGTYYFSIIFDGEEELSGQVYLDGSSNFYTIDITGDRVSVENY